MKLIIGKSLLFVLVGLISTIILLLLPPPPAAYATGGSFEIHQKGTAGGALNYVIIKDAVGSTPGEVSVIGSGRNDDKKALVRAEQVGTVIIPEIVENAGSSYRVTEVGNYAFGGKWVGAASKFITEPVFPVSVERLENYAFGYCPNLVSTGLSGENCRVKSVNIGAYALCRELTSTGLESNDSVVSINGNDLNRVGFWNCGYEDRGSFQGCIKLTETGIGGATKLEKIGNGAMYGTNTGFVGAFQDCLNIAFTGFEGSTSLKFIGSNAFFNCKGLIDTGLSSNKSVETLGLNAFLGCVSLKRTGLAENSTLKQLHGGTFNGCVTLESTGFATNDTLVEIVPSRQVMGAFNKCISLVDTGLEFNKSLRGLGGGPWGEDGTFRGCSSLPEVAYIPANQRENTLGPGIYAECPNIKTLVFLGDSKRIVSDKAAIYNGMTNLKNVICFGSKPTDLFDRPVSSSGLNFDYYYVVDYYETEGDALAKANKVGTAIYKEGTDLTTRETAETGLLFGFHRESELYSSSIDSLSILNSGYAVISVTSKKNIFDIASDTTPFVNTRSAFFSEDYDPSAEPPDPRFSISSSDIEELMIKIPKWKNRSEIKGKAEDYSKKWGGACFGISASELVNHEIIDDFETRFHDPGDKPFDYINVQKPRDNKELFSRLGYYQLLQQLFDWNDDDDPKKLIFYQEAPSSEKVFLLDSEREARLAKTGQWLKENVSDEHPVVICYQMDRRDSISSSLISHAVLITGSFDKVDDSPSGFSTYRAPVAQPSKKPENRFSDFIYLQFNNETGNCTKIEFIDSDDVLRPPLEKEGFSTDSQSFLSVLLFNRAAFENKAVPFSAEEGEELEEDDSIVYDHDPKPVGHIEDASGNTVTNFGKPGAVTATSSNTPIRFGMTETTTLKAPNINEINFVSDNADPFSDISLYSKNNSLTISGLSSGINSAIMNADDGIMNIAGENFSCRLGIGGYNVGSSDSRAMFELFSSSDIEITRTSDGSMIVSSNGTMVVNKQTLWGSNVADDVIVEGMDLEVSKIIVTKNPVLGEPPLVTFA